MQQIISEKWKPDEMMYVMMLRDEKLLGVSYESYTD